MESYTKEQRITTVMIHFKNGACFPETVRQISEIFGAECTPTEADVRKLIDKFDETGSVLLSHEEKKPKASTSNTSSSNKRKRPDPVQISTPERQRIIDKYKKILEAMPTVTSTSVVAEIVNSIGVSKAAVCRVIKEGKENGDIPEKKRVRVRHIADYTNEEPVVESVRRIIDTFTEKNEYPSVYQVYSELKLRKDIPKMSQTMLYKIMKQIANDDHRNNQDIDDSEKFNDDSEEGSESDSSNVNDNGDNQIEHIEIKPEIIMDDYEEESIPAIKDEPDDLSSSGENNIAHGNVGPHWEET